MKTLIDYYDEFAQKWADDWYDNEQLLPYLKEFLKYLPQNPKVLDLCCGAGYESMRLSKLGAEVVGADLSEKSIEIAKFKNPYLTFFVKDMLKSYKDLGRFDGLACIAGLVHIEEKNLELAFKNMYEVLNDNAFILVVLKDGDKIIEFVEIGGVKYARKFYCYTLDKLKLHSAKYFSFDKDLSSQGDWKYYIFKKLC